MEGTFTAGGTLTLLIGDGYDPVYGTSFTIFNGATPGFDSGAFAISTNLGGGLFWDTSALASSGVVTVVPEPGVLGLLGLSAMGLFFRRRVVRC